MHARRVRDFDLRFGTKGLRFEDEYLDCMWGFEGCDNYRKLPKTTEIYRKLTDVRHTVTGWHYNETLALTLTLTLTLKLTVIYGVKDDTKTKLHLMLYIKVISVAKGWGCKGSPSRSGHH